LPATMCLGLVRRLKKRWFLFALGVAVSLGFCLRNIAPVIPRDAPVALFMFTMFCIGLTATPSALLRSLTNWRATLVCLGFSYLMAPGVAFVSGWMLLDPASDLFRGWVLVGCTSTTISSAIVYARSAGANATLALVLSNISSVASPMLTPVLVGVLLSKQIDVPVAPMMKTLFLSVVAPVLFAQIVLVVAARLVAPIRPHVGIFSQVGIVLIVFMSMARTFHLAPPVFYRELPGAVTVLVVLSVALYAALSTGSYSAARRAGLGPADAVAVAYTSGQKTMAVTVVLADRFFSPVAAVPILVYHLTQLVCGELDAGFYRRQIGKGQGLPVSEPDTARSGTVSRT
jgi:bile acid:Na+ symporter, BASS family